MLGLYSCATRHMCACVFVCVCHHHRALDSDAPGDKLDPMTAGSLRAAYAVMEVPLTPSLGAALGKLDKES